MVGKSRGVLEVLFRGFVKGFVSQGGSVRYGSLPPVGWRISSFSTL